MKILLILMRTLGDVILGNTLAAELKKKYPDSEITFAVWPEYVEIVDSNPNIKSLVITKDWDVVLQDASSGRYDKVLVPFQCTHEDTCWHHNPRHKDGHLIDFYAKRCKIEITERKEYVYFSDKDLQGLDFYSKKITSGEYTVIHTTSLVESKNWNQFGEMVEQMKGTVIQVGGPDDVAIPGTYDLRGKLTFKQIAALLSIAQIFIGVDSGISYISSAVGCPTICIMGMSTQKTSGPIGPNTHFIEPERPKGCEWPCHTNCRHKNPCIRTITVEQVLTKVKEVLNGKKK